MTEQQQASKEVDQVYGGQSELMKPKGSINSESIKHNDGRYAGQDHFEDDALIRMTAICDTQVKQIIELQQRLAASQATIAAQEATIRKLQNKRGPA